MAEDQFRTCPVCGGPKAYSSELCPACQEEYGDRSTWPEWLLFLARDDRRLRREDRALVQRELSVGLDVEDAVLYLDWSGALAHKQRTAPVAGADLSWWDELLHEHEAEPDLPLTQGE